MRFQATTNMNFDNQLEIFQNFKLSHSPLETPFGCFSEMTSKTDLKDRN